MSEKILDAEAGLVACDHKKAAIIGVYAIVHLRSGRCYVGSSNNVTRRMQNHFGDLMRRKHHTAALQDLWNAEGLSAFRVVVLEYCDPIELIFREQIWIDAFPDQLNRSRIAWNCMLDPAIAQRAGLKRRGRRCPWVSEAMKRRSGVNWVGPADIVESGRKLGLSNRGRKHGPHSPDRGAKISAGNKRAWADPKARRLRGLAISRGKRAAIAARQTERVDAS